MKLANNSEITNKNNNIKILRFLREIDYFKKANFNQSNGMYDIKHSLNRKKFISKYLKRFLSEDYELLILSHKNLSIRIHIPISYLINDYNKNISSYGLIQYFKYPLLSPENKNFSENVLSINLYDSDFNVQDIKDLRVPIDIFIKKPHNSFNNCLFIDPTSYKWNDKGCKSLDLGDTLMCSCNHLTDFSIAKYNPVKIIEDIMNVFADAWIINDFNTFKNLNFKNATSLYIFFGILFLYLFGLLFTIRYDVKDQYDIFVYEVDRDISCCSTLNTLESIREIKEEADKAEEKRIQNSLKHLEIKFKNYKIHNIIAKSLKLDLKTLGKKFNSNSKIIEHDENEGKYSNYDLIKNEF